MRGSAHRRHRLCLTARKQDYVKAALAGWDEEGPCSAIGHRARHERGGRAFVNGTAAHGEDFDDTFEGGPCMPVPSSCRRCSQPASATIPTGPRRCSASRSASR